MAHLVPREVQNGLGCVGSAVIALAALPETPARFSCVDFHSPSTSFSFFCLHCYLEFEHFEESFPVWALSGYELRAGSAEKINNRQKATRETSCRSCRSCTSITRTTAIRERRKIFVQYKCLTKGKIHRRKRETNRETRPLRRQCDQLD